MLDSSVLKRLIAVLALAVTLVAVGLQSRESTAIAGADWDGSSFSQSRADATGLEILQRVRAGQTVSARETADGLVIVSPTGSIGQAVATAEQPVTP